MYLGGVPSTDGHSAFHFSPILPADTSEASQIQSQWLLARRLLEFSQIRQHHQPQSGLGRYEDSSGGATVVGMVVVPAFSRTVNVDRERALSYSALLPPDCVRKRLIDVSSVCTKVHPRPIIEASFVGTKAHEWATMSISSVRTKGRQLATIRRILGLCSYKSSSTALLSVGTMPCDWCFICTWSRFR